MLQAAGILTFAELAAREPAALREIIAAGGVRIGDPTTWPEQAALAAAGRWDELTALQGEPQGRTTNVTVCQQEHLSDLISRALPPEPWAEGDNIPWDDPAFSARMLREHLTQDHDLASRRAAKIDAQVAWIHAARAGGRALRAFSTWPAAPACMPHGWPAWATLCWASTLAPPRSPMLASMPPGFACTYVLGDIRRADYRGPHDLAMLLYGQFNVFRPDEARAILAKAWQALRPGGLLLLEPHTFAAVREVASAPRWSAHASGLFSAAPHLLLVESFWDEARAASTERFYVVDAASGAVSGAVTRYALSMQAYSNDDYAALLHAVGYTDVTFYPSLIGEPDESQSSLLAITARRPSLAAAARTLTIKERYHVTSRLRWLARGSMSISLSPRSTPAPIRRLFALASAMSAGCPTISPSSRGQTDAGTPWASPTPRVAPPCTRPSGWRFTPLRRRASLPAHLTEGAWEQLPHVLPPAERPNERHELYAPFAIERDGLFYLFYGPTEMRLATSPDLFHWQAQGVLFGGEEGARDPCVLWLDGRYVMVYIAGRRSLCARVG